MPVNRLLWRRITKTDADSNPHSLERKASIVPRQQGARWGRILPSFPQRAEVKAASNDLCCHASDHVQLHVDHGETLGQEQPFARER